MKKFLLLLALAFTCIGTASAQLSVGARAGLLSTSYWTLSSENGGNRLLTKPQFGVVAENRFTERLSVRAEFNYAPKGDAWYFGQGAERENIRDVYNYLELPVLAKYLITEGKFDLYAIGGLYAAIALSNKYSEDNTTYSFKNFPRSDFGLQLGVGAARPISHGQIFAELRYTQGLKNIDAFKSETATRFSGIGISLGWMTTL